MVAIPVSTLAVLALWLVMLMLYPDEQKPSQANQTSPRPALDDEELQRQNERDAYEEQEQQEAAEGLTYAHYFFLFVSVAALLGITVFMPALEPIVGHGACISLLVVVMAFGSGFMTRDEFLQLDWDLLMLVGGTNVMAFLVRETGLGADLSAKLVGSEFFTMLPYWGFLMVILMCTVAISTTVG